MSSEAASSAQQGNNKQNDDESSDEGGFTAVYADPPPKQSRKGKRKSSAKAAPPPTPQQFYAVRTGINVSNAVFFRWEDAEPEVSPAEDDDVVVEFETFQDIEDAWEYIATGSAASDVVHPRKRSKNGSTSSKSARESSSHKRWEESYRELVEFKAKHGHTLVPVNRKEQSKLSRWVSRQRLEYRYLTEGKPTAMNEERFRKLNEIGFAFKAWEAKRVATMTGAPGGDPGFGLPTVGAGTAPAIAQAAQQAAASAHAEAAKKAAAAAKESGTSTSGTTATAPAPTPADASAIAAANAAAAPFVPIYHQVPPTMEAARRQAAAAAASGVPPLPPGGGPIPHPGTYSYPNSYYISHLGSKAQKFALTFDINLRALLAYKEEHGSCDVPGNHPTLGAWVKQMRNLCKKKEKGKKFEPMTEDQHQRLMDAGFVMQARRGPKGPTAAHKSPSGTKGRPVKDDGNWDTMYAQLREFQEREGHTKVPTKETALRNWVVKQKNEYKRLRNDEPSQLTARRVQMLNDLNITWETKKTLKWSDRFDQLERFKAKQNHCIVPRNYDDDGMEGLGKWLAQQRHAFRLFNEGKPTTMTAERAQQLNDLGMVWSILKPSTKPRAERKPWQERFEELKAYKAEKGNTLVPQTYEGGLGAWVHQQRTMYQKLKAGQKSMMNDKKIEKLKSIGFIFRVKKSGKEKQGAKSAIDIAIHRAEKSGALVKTSSGYAPAAASAISSGSKPDNDDVPPPPPPLPPAEVDGGNSEYESANDDEAVMM